MTKKPKQEWEKRFNEKFHDGEYRIGDRKDNYSTMDICSKIKSFIAAEIEKAFKAGCRKAGTVLNCCPFGPAGFC